MVTGVIRVLDDFYTQRHCHVRIEKGPVQTVAIKLEAHNSLKLPSALRETFRYKNTNYLNKQYFTVLMKIVLQFPIKVTEVT